MKKIILFILYALVVSTVSVFASDIYRNYTAKEVQYVVDINGQRQNFELPIVSIEDSTYIAVRQLCEKMGYNVEWIEDEKKIKIFSVDESLSFDKDIYNSQEGTLSDGTKFNYIAQDDFSYHNQINQWGMISAKGDYGEVPTAKLAAEIGKDILGYNNLETIIQVYYDSGEDVWFIYGLNNNTMHSGLRSVAIRRSDGKIIDKYELR